MSNIRIGFLKILSLILPFIMIYLLLFIFGETLVQAHRWARDFETHPSKDFEFVVSTELGFISETLRDYEDRLNWFKQEFHLKYKDLFHLVPMDNRIPIWFCKNHEELVKYGWKTLHQDLTHNGGFYDPVNRRIAIVSRRGVEADEDSLFHEMTHAILDLGTTGDPQWSAWLNEGLAQYFEGSIYNQQLGRLDSKSVHTVKAMLDGDHATPFIPLARLIESSESPFTSDENAPYYAESHLLVYYLLTTHSPQFSLYIMEERKPGRALPSMFEQCFGPLDALEREFKEYVRSRF